MTAEFFKPLIQTFMMALPYTYRNCKPEKKSVVKVEITGESGGVWCIQYIPGKWIFFDSDNSQPDTIIKMNPDTAWKLMTKALSREASEERITIEGDKELGQPIFTMASVMA